MRLLIVAVVAVLSVAVVSGPEVEFKLKYNEGDSFNCERSLKFTMTVTQMGQERNSKGNMEADYTASIKKINENGTIGSYECNVKKFKSEIDNGMNQSSTEGDGIVGEKITFEDEDIKVNDEAVPEELAQFVGLLSLKNLNMIELYEERSLKVGDSFLAEKTEKEVIDNVRRRMGMGNPSGGPKPEVELNKESGELKYLVEDITGNNVTLKLTGEIKCAMKMVIQGVMEIPGTVTFNFDYTYEIDSSSGKVASNRGKQATTYKMNAMGQEINQKFEYIHDSRYKY